MCSIHRPIRVAIGVRVVMGQAYDWARLNKPNQSTDVVAGDRLAQRSYALMCALSENDAMNRTS